METYRIVRFFFQGDKGRMTARRRITIKRGLTLEQAQAHCGDRETSSTTCTTAIGRRRTKTYGPWFDGYERER